MRFPDPIAPTRRPCESCGTPARVDRMTDGHGSKCARKAGLTTATPRVRTTTQTGPNLLDHLEGEPHDELIELDDCCDGWDR